MLFEITRGAPGGGRARARAPQGVRGHAPRDDRCFPKLARKGKELLDICVEINRLENEADAIYRRAIAELFHDGNDPIDVMKWRDIFDNLEEATDRCEDVANIVEGVVLEYA